MMAQLQQNVKGSRSSEGEIPLQSVEHHWSTIFKKYDNDNDGRLSLRELCDQVNSPAFAHDIPEQAIRNIFRQYDVNNDGYINFDEFLSLLESDVGRRLWNRTLNRYIKNTVVPRGPKRVFTHRRGHIDSTDGDYEDQYSCVPPPICMFLVSAVEIGFFLYDIASYGNNDKITGFGPAAQLFYYSPHKRSQFWRFITYMFVHANFFHLIVNLAVQVLLGVPLEMVHRWWRVLIIYLAGVLAGSLATSVSDPEVSLAGASGGVYAIITAHLSTIILNWSEMEFAVWQLIIFLLLMIVDIGQYIYARYFIETQLKIGYVAHLGGAVAGLLVGLYVLRNLEEHSWEKVLKWIGFILYIFLIGFAIFYNYYYVVM